MIRYHPLDNFNDSTQVAIGKKKNYNSERVRFSIAQACKLMSRHFIPKSKRFDSYTPSLSVIKN